MLARNLLNCLLVICLPCMVFAQERQATPNQVQRATENQDTPETEVDEASTVDKASFLFGYNFITRLKQQNADYNYEQVLAGLKAAEEEADAGMTLEEQRSVLQTWQTIQRAKAVKRRQEMAESNGAEGTKAMAEFAKQKGAKELEDGVMYVVINEGDGPVPEKPDRVKINYKGMFTDGEVFDSTEEKGEPLVNPVMRFVPGFSAAIQSMKVGSKWKLFVRGDKAYGMRPPNREMGPNRALIFEIELLEIMPIE